MRRGVSVCIGFALILSIVCFAVYVALCPPVEGWYSNRIRLWGRGGVWYIHLNDGLIWEVDTNEGLISGGDPSLVTARGRVMGWYCRKGRRQVILHVWDCLYPKTL